MIDKCQSSNHMKRMTTSDIIKNDNLKIESDRWLTNVTQNCYYYLYISRLFSIKRLQLFYQLPYVKLLLIYQKLKPTSILLSQFFWFYFIFFFSCFYIHVRACNSSIRKTFHKGEDIHFKHVEFESVDPNSAVPFFNSNFSFTKKKNWISLCLSYAFKLGPARAPSLTQLGMPVNVLLLGPSWAGPAQFLLILHAIQWDICILGARSLIIKYQCIHS